MKDKMLKDLWDEALVDEAVGRAFGQTFGWVQYGDARSRHEFSLQRKSIYKSGSLSGES